jgi:hypothetical protein
MEEISAFRRHHQLYEVGKTACIKPETSDIIAFINAETTPEEFDAYRKQFVDYQFHHQGDGKNSYTALYKAVMSQNLPLAKYIATNDKKGLDLLCGTTELGSSLWKAVLTNNFSMVEMLINRGADVNVGIEVCVWDREPKQGLKHLFHVSPLYESTGRWVKNINIAKLLVESGAELYRRYSPSAMRLLEASKNKHIESPLLLIADARINGVYIKQSLSKKHNKLLEMAQNEIYSEKIAFFSGLYDSKSPISILPKEIVARILSYRRTGTNSLRCGEKEIVAAITTLCQRELLFALGRSDPNSSICCLPHEIIQSILKIRILIDLSYTR